MGNIKGVAVLFCFIILFVGCGPSLSENRYLEVEIYPNPEGPYIGKWTAAMPGGLFSMKINPDGTAFACTSNKYFGTGKGKVFKEKEKIKIIFESGTIFVITSISDKYMMIDSYGQEYKFLKDNVPENCTKYFR